MPARKTTKIETIRHSLSHIMALAVKELYDGVHPVKSRKAGISPKAKLFNRVKFGIGPAIENGFYYDFDFSAVSNRADRHDLKQENITIADLAKIEKRMLQLIKKDLKFEKKEISTKEAKKLFNDQPYKLDLIKELTDPVSIYQVGEFVDLCKGPHVKSTKEINPRAFKLTKVAGAYWRGDEKNPMLTRIYGLAFATEKELKDHLKQLEEAEKRDHRVLGKKLDIYSIDAEVGSGLILWHPKGALLRQLIRQYWIEEHFKEGYEIIETPHIGRLKLWQTSGHTDFYKENMYGPMKVENELYQLKPMNCPFHVKIYNFQMRSYRDLPLRWAEWAQVYRYEKSGVLHGLTRVRGFTQDDAHIICTKEQFEDELNKVVRFIKKMLGDFGFKDYGIYLSARDPKEKKKYIGDDKTWDFAEKTLEEVLKQNKLKYVLDIGEAKFYGPAIDIKIKDAIGREWQCSTLQLDMNLPERFKMFYIDKKGKKQTPIMLHRTLLGGVCRFIAVLLEHYEGALPVWLSPVQGWVVPVGSDHRKYAKELAETLKEKGLRVEARVEAETVGKKIREGEIQKIPYLLVVGDKEIKAKSVRVRQRAKGDIGEMALNKFLEKIQAEIEKKR